MIRRLSLLFAFFISFFHAYDQVIELQVQNKSLTSILFDLNKKYNVQTSIDSKLSNDCILTVSKKFSSIHSLTKYLANQCHCDLQKIGDVYSFRKIEIKTHQSDSTFLFQGIVVDLDSKEPLPFSRLQIDQQSIYADEKGRFTYRSTRKTSQFQVVHLAYHKKDTVLSYSHRHKIELKAQNIDLEEVEIKANKFRVGNVGTRAGHLKFNDITQALLPGNSSNIIFNLLRLYPGVLASGEMNSDFSIWGSFPGQSQMIYDGINLFSAFGSHNDIGQINPFMIKNMEVYKAGYSVDVGDRIGGVILVNGKEGNKKRFESQLNISNQLSNLYLNMPLFKNRSTLQIAGRISYFQLVNWSEILKKDQEELVYPNYHFGDVNVKFNSEFKNKDRLAINLIFSGDLISTKVNQVNQFIYNSNTRSIQFGGSVKYDRVWKKGGVSQFTLAHSQYHSNLNSDYVLIDTLVFDNESGISKMQNSIHESSLRIDHQFPTVKKNGVKLGGGYVYDSFQYQIENNSNLDQNAYLDRVYVYVNDRMDIVKQFNIILGIKLSVPIQNPNVFIDPNIQLQYKINDYWQISGMWGVYSQFVSKIEYNSDQFESNFLWRTMNSEGFAPLRLMHSVLGFSYVKNWLELSVDGFHKMGRNMSLLSSDEKSGEIDVNQQESQSYGADLFLKFKFKKQEILTSYSFSRVFQEFSKNSSTYYISAPQEQIHEWKVAGIFHFKQFRFSIVNVLGSGFETYQSKDNMYNRLDCAFQYTVVKKEHRISFGFSVLNMLGRRNIKLNYGSLYGESSKFNLYGIPFTPMLFLKYSFR